MTQNNTPTLSTPTRRALFSAAAIGSTLVLASCGGGGGGGGSTPSPTPSPSASVDLSLTGALVATGFPDPFTNPPTQRPRAIVGDTLVQVRFVASNSGPQTASGGLFALPAVSGFTPTAISCGSASGGSSCPSGLTLQAAAGGVAVTLPAGGAMTFTVSGTVTQAGSIAPRATIAAPSGQTETNTSNNSAQVAIAVEAPAPSTLVASVPAHTYRNGTAQGEQYAQAFEWLNGIRSRCGFGLLRQDTRLDQAAADHANYMVLNGGTLTHTQEPGKPGFTGVTTKDRAVLRGYPTAGNAVDELAGGFPSSTLRDTQRLTTGTYHAQGMLGGFRDIGLATALSQNLQGVTPVTLGVQEPVAQLVAGDQISVYPCEGETLARRSHGGENPNPIPGADLNSYGPALTAVVRGDQTLVVTEWTITPIGGTPLATTLRTKGTDPNSMITQNSAVLIPNAVLAPNTTYNVVLKGTNSGVPFERRYSFRTGD